MTSSAQIRRMFPEGHQAWLKAFESLAPVLARHYGFSDHAWRHFCGQIFAETNGLSLGSMRENMRFTTAARIRTVYSYRLRKALERDKDLARRHGTVQRLAEYCVGKPDLLADIAYGGREGTPYGQGHRYIGRGPSQITHLNNYRAIHRAILEQPGGSLCPDLVEHPEMLEMQEWGVRSAFADWHIKGLSRWADNDDLKNVSSVLNTGKPHNWDNVNGKDNRRRGLARAVAVWPLDQPIFGPGNQQAPVHQGAPDAALSRGDVGDEVRHLQELLAARGYHAGEVDGSYGSLTERAVIVAQHANGLEATGRADKRLLDVLERTAPETLPRQDMTEDDLAERGSRTYDEAAKLTWYGKALKWLGWPTSGAGIAEAVSPGSVSQFVSVGPKLAEALTSPSMIRLYVVAGGFGLLALGWRLTGGGKAIIGYRLEDARSGKHIGR